MARKGDGIFKRGKVWWLILTLAVLVLLIAMWLLVPKNLETTLFFFRLSH
jgi:hypothetical protein